jgi:hypothetical protein
MRVVLAVVFAASAASCSGDSPTSPEAAGHSASAAGGAVIEGQVTASTSGASTRSMAGLAVEVVGTSLSTAVNESGGFRVADVPAGRVRLRFSSASVNATTELNNVAQSDVIQIQVQVSANSAVIVSQTRANDVSLCHREGNGTYHLISVAPEAEPAHRAHGDGTIGDPVPDQANMVFDEACSPVGPLVDIEKSTNGEDADTAPGPSIPVGSPVSWAYEVSNTGTVPLTGIVVSDDQGVSVACDGQTSLAPGASMTCTGSGVATLGQYANVGSVSANWTMGSSSGTVTDSDASHYLGIAPTTDSTEKVTLCHKTGTPKYVEITVSVDAEPAHRRHGDAKPGEVVPGQADKTFGTGCQVV